MTSEEESSSKDSAPAAEKYAVLFSALLLTTEVFNIDFSDKPFPGYDISFHGARDKVPIAFLALVIYFTVRLILKWMSGPPRPKDLATTLDRCFTLMIITSSIALFVWMRLAGVSVPPLRIAFLSSPFFLFFLLGHLWGMASGARSVLSVAVGAAPPKYMMALCSSVLLAATYFTVSSGSLRSPTWSLIFEIALAVLLGRGCGWLYVGIKRHNHYQRR